jgi:hypothetical protein
VGGEGEWKQPILTGDISVWITRYFGTKRRADINSVNKLSLDAALSRGR